MNMKTVINILSVVFITCLLPTQAVASSDEFVPEKYQNGKQTFMRYCALCHGTKANGQGRMAPLYRRTNGRQPSNFTVRYYQSRPIEYLKAIIIDGGKAHGLSEHMPPFKSELSEQQLDDVVYFIKSISKFSYPSK